jgi:hypothetical protein
MKSAQLMCTAAIALLARVAIPLQLDAQDKQDHKSNHHHYQLVDIGTFGGPESGTQERTQSAQQPRDAGGLRATSHAYVFIPCDEHHPGVEGGDYSMVEASTSVPQTSPISNATSGTLPQLLMHRMDPRYPFPGTAAGPRN